MSANYFDKPLHRPVPGLNPTVNSTKDNKKWKGTPWCLNHIKEADLSCLSHASLGEKVHRLKKCS